VEGVGLAGRLASRRVFSDSGLETNARAERGEEDQRTRKGDPPCQDVAVMAIKGDVLSDRANGDSQFPRRS